MLGKLSVALGLCGLATASPASARKTEIYPDLETSKGFNLIVNLTLPESDFDPPIHNSYVTTIHVGAGLAKVGTSSTKGPVFFQNGTIDSRVAGASTVITLSGTPPTPAGLKLRPDTSPVGFSSGTLDFGPGTPGIALFEKPVAYLIPEKFYACNESLEYYKGQHFVIIRQSVGGVEVPTQCRSVRLLPECAELDELPDDSDSSYDFALESYCYNDVSAIDWTKYSQF